MVSSGRAPWRRAAWEIKAFRGRGSATHFQKRVLEFLGSQKVFLGVLGQISVGIMGPWAPHGPHGPMAPYGGEGVVR